MQHIFCISTLPSHRQESRQNFVLLPAGVLQKKSVKLVIRWREESTSRNRQLMMFVCYYWCKQNKRNNKTGNYTDSNSRKNRDNWKEKVIIEHCMIQGFLGGDSGKESTCQCWICKRSGFDPRVGKIPRRSKKWQPTPVFLSGGSPWIEEPGGP